MLNSPHLTLHLPDEAATESFGAALAEALAPGLVIYLGGDLGAGKTAVVRSTLRAMGHVGPVKSPTYTLVELYKVSSLCLYHFDFYRFTDPEEFIDAGFSEYFRADTVCCVEWADKAAGAVPAPDLVIQMAYVAEDDGRDACCVARSDRGASCLNRLVQSLKRTAERRAFLSERL